MFWADELARQLPPDRPHVVNDSKTPSGTIPISSLRGPVMHDAVSRALKDAGREVRYTFGIDDMDPMDSATMRLEEAWAPHMGKPLSRIPSPEPGFSDFADLHATRFLDTYGAFGIQPEFYRTRDLYREGKFDEAIDLVLRNAAKVREILGRVANVRHAADPNYHALFVVCENCGRVGTTYVTAYDGREVRYDCRPDLVSWAEGCGHRGRISPFGGNAKLPYVEEWCAKWDLFGVTFEACGKDLATAGGARERSDALYREIWKKKPPLNLPYEFLTLKGKKISTSHAAAWRELGAAAHEMARLLTGEIIRFLMLRPRPNAEVELDPTGDRIPRLFDEYDRAAEAFARDPDEDLARSYALSQLDRNAVRAGFRVRFGLVADWAQMPSVRPERAAAELKGAPLDEWERRELEQRLRVARTWLERWAPDDEKFTVQDRLPAVARELSPRQREYLRRVDALLANGLKAEDLHARLFDLYKELGMEAREAFAAIYLAFIGKPSGPPAGWILAADREFSRRRIAEAVEA